MQISSPNSTLKTKQHIVVKNIFETWGSSVATITAPGISKMISPLPRYSMSFCYIAAYDEAERSLDFLLNIQPVSHSQSNSPLSRRQQPVLVSSRFYFFSRSALYLMHDREGIPMSISVRRILDRVHDFHQTLVALAVQGFEKCVSHVDACTYAAACPHVAVVDPPRRGNPADILPV